MSETSGSKPSSVIVALAAVSEVDGTAPTKSVVLARTLAAAFDVELKSMHVDDAGDAHDDGHTEQLAQDIAARLPVEALLVIESEHADRWRGRHSVAEHVIDAFAGPAVALGPNAAATLPDGPVLIALDGSSSAEASLGSAIATAEALGRSVALVRVVAEPLHPDGDDAARTASNYVDQVAEQLGEHVAGFVVASNDPVTAIVSLATEQSCALIALASKGDRSTTRSSMSRTAAGLIADATSPVLVVGSG